LAEAKPSANGRPRTNRNADLRARLASLPATAGASGWSSARCPAHDDQNPSMGFAIFTDDSVSLKCHAGCNTGEILQALGNFAKRDLFPPRLNGRQIVAAYDYTDERGKLLFQAVRFEPKDFRQRRPDGKGGWVWNLDSVRRVPYRLPKVVAAVKQRIRLRVVEGEKDADRFAEVGLCATTNPGGAGKWKGEYNEFLKGAHVAAIPGLHRRRDATEGAVPRPGAVR
jgi:hypothetical protein